MMIDVILDNISYMLTNKTSNEKIRYQTSSPSDKQIWEKYDNFLPQLKRCITMANQFQKNAKRLKYLEELKILYEDVILQTSDYLNQHQRQLRYQHYLSNCKIVQNNKMRISLDNLAYIGDQFGKTRHILRSLSINFKDYIKIDLQSNIPFNLANIESYLYRSKAEAQENLLKLGEMNSISILLNQITSKIQHNSPLHGFKEVLDNIKAEVISKPLNQLYELLDRNNINLIAHKNQQKIIKEINEMLDIHEDERQLTEGLQEIKKKVSVSHSDQIMFDHFQKELYNQGKIKVMEQIVSLVSLFTSEPLKKKSLAMYDERQLAELKDEFSKKIEESKEGWSSSQQGNVVITLKKDMEKLTKEYELLQLNESSLNDHILTLKKQIKQLKANYSSLFFSLKNQVGQLKNQIQTYFLDVKHRIEDQIQIYFKEFRQKIHAYVERIAREHDKELNKVQEKRRAEKTKLSNDIQEISNQFAQLTQKYYRDLSAKLCKSRLDISVSRIDNVETNDCAVGNSFMLLENSLLNEQSFVVGADREEEEKQTEEQLMTSINRHLQDQTDKLKKKIGEQEQIISILNEEISKDNQMLTEERAKLSKLMNELQLNQKIVSQKQAFIAGLLQTIKKLKTVNLDYESTIKKLNQTANTSSPHSIVLTKTNSAVPLFIPYSNVLFQAEIFSDNSHHKETLIRHIQAYMKIQIIRTNLLHKFDPNNKANFHLYIDNKKHLICVVKTKHAIIAGFYPGQLKEGVIMNEGGLLVSVTNDQSYSLMQKKNDSKINYRGMTYDPYYVIFGNAEMRVRSGEKRVFCNFGIQNSYFDYTNKPRNIEAFLNNQFREVEFQYCEFYQLIFQEPYPSSFDQLTSSP